MGVHPGSRLVYELEGPERDARAVQARGDELGFEPVAHLIGEDATSTRFLDAVNVASTRARRGDLVVVYFSGHGVVTPAEPPRVDAFDGGFTDLASAICFRDRILLDVELAALYARFAGRRLLVLLDSCYSGGMASGLTRLPRSTRERRGDGSRLRGPVASPASDVDPTARAAQATSTPQVQMLCAAGDGIARGGVFTRNLLELQRGYTSDYAAFADHLDARVRSDLAVGAPSITYALSAPVPSAFVAQRPLQID